MPWPPPFSEPDARAAVAASISWSAALRALGYQSKGANIRTLQRWVKRWEISTENFDPAAARGIASAARARPLEQVMVEDSTYPRGKLKRRLYAAGAQTTGVRAVRPGRDMERPADGSCAGPHQRSLYDHRMENLQIVCPNCAATLDTHCGRNVPQERTCPGCGQAFAPTTMQHRYCSQACWGTVYGERLRGIAQPHLRKVERPPHAQLDGGRPDDEHAGRRPQVRGV